MTTIFKEEIACGLCSGKSEYDIIGSTNTSGSPDLDTRPPAHLRYTINTWVQRCPHCGYCASNIEEVSKTTESMINSEKYQLQLENTAYPELANSFLCEAILKSENGDIGKVAWSAIHAAWACDDSGDDESARKCRMKAVELVNDVGSSGQSISDGLEADIAITVDLLRRAGQFDEALQMIEQKHGEIKDEIIKKILKFPKELISRSDNQCHTIDEVLEG